ncbi:MAG: hypothetical protein DYH06_13105, partial [Acidobacteria bacterium ACB2]|nr:hypothetical protein [Acidobacteria bacterium ACB2]
MDLGRGARKYTPADAGFSQTGANTEVAAVAAVTIDVIFYAICELISPRDAMRLCLTCRDLSGALRARRAHVYSAFPARLIAKHGLRDALEARWSRFGHTQPEVDEALVGACAGAQDALARWLLTRPE